MYTNKRSDDIVKHALFLVRYLMVRERDLNKNRKDSRKNVFQKAKW